VRVSCVEIGGGTIQTVVLDGASHTVADGAHSVEGSPLLMASPGLMNGTRIFAASNLGWYDVDPAEELGLPTSALMLLNDAHAAALGEFALRGAKRGLTYIGLGTGVGSAIIDVVAGEPGRIAERSELGHLAGFSERLCQCGRTGCLETLCAGWALPDPLTEQDLQGIVSSLAQALTYFHADSYSSTDPSRNLVVLAGGLTRSYPELVERLAAALPDHQVEASAAPAECKSAAAWGLRYAFEHHVTARQLSPVEIDLREAPVPDPQV
jgi:predicted NBD/HSP70 family sugar kinase